MFNLAPTLLYKKKKKKKKKTPFPSVIYQALLFFSSSPLILSYRDHFYNQLNKVPKIFPIKCA